MVFQNDFVGDRCPVDFNISLIRKSAVIIFIIFLSVTVFTIFVILAIRLADRFPLSPIC